MTVAFGDVDISFAVETNFVRRTELRRFCRTTVTGMSFRSAPGNDRNPFCTQIETQHSIASKVSPIQRSIRSDDETEGIIDGGRFCGLAVGNGSGFPGARNGSEALRGRLR